MAVPRKNPFGDMRIRALLAVVTLGVVVLGVRQIQRKAAAREEARALEAMGDTLEALRISFDSCRWELGRREVAFQEFDRHVDSLREEIRRYEAQDERGVPQEQYDPYLETFDLYNESVARWEGRADSLRAHSETCREFARLHNALADTLQGRLDARRQGPDPPPG